jgi:hypothetical protein
MQTLKKFEVEAKLLEKIERKYKEDEDFAVFNKLYRSFKYGEFYSIPLNKLEDNFYIQLFKFISEATFGVKFKQIARTFGKSELRAKLNLLIRNFGIVEYEERKYKVNEEGKRFEKFLEEHKNFAAKS